MTIRLDGVTKSFGETVVVKDVGLDVQDGELFVLLGRSGSGKSTILRLVAGLIDPDAGRIEINGADVTRLPPGERNVGFVFQNYSIFRHMTAAQNVAFGPRIRGVDPGKRSTRVDELLELVGLSGLGDRYPAQLSGGQQQRVALARALAYDPAVLLLDEPFGALDVVIRSQLRASLKAIQRRVKVTTILVTHDQEEAFELADRVGVIERGRIVEVGTPEELYHRPRTEFVAGFIGGGNVLVGRAYDDHVRLGAVALPLPPDGPKHDKGQPARVLVRPEAVAVAPDAFPADAGLFLLGTGRIAAAKFAGPLERVRLEVDALRGARAVTPAAPYGQSAPTIEAVVPSRSDHSAWLRPGEKVHVAARTYHVLQPTGLKILVGVRRQRTDSPAVAFGCALAAHAGASATLLSVASSTGRRPDTTAALEAVRQKWRTLVPAIEAHVRVGDAPPEILREAQEGQHDLVVVGYRRPGRFRSGIRLGSTVWRLLERAGVPVVLVQAPARVPQKILICTTAGEPGKADVLVGGRLARSLGATAVVLHVLRGSAAPRDRERAEGHLLQARESLASLGVEATTLIEPGDPVPTILRVAAEGDHDLVVIGAPAPRPERRVTWSDAAGRIIDGTDRPVLVVPMGD